MVAFAQAFATYFVTLVEYGFPLSATRQVAIRRGEMAHLARVFSQVLWAKTLLGAAGLVVLLGFVVMFPLYREQSVLFLASYTAVLGTILSADWFFLGLQDMRLVAITGVVSRTLATVLIFLVVEDEGDYIYIPLLTGVGPIVAGSLGQWFVRRRGVVILKPNLKGIGGQLRDGFDTFLSSASISLYTTSNTFILGLVSDSASVGYYSAAEKVVAGVRALWTPVPQALYPHFSEVFAHDRARGRRQLRVALAIAGVITGAISVSGAISAPLVVHRYLGQRFHDSTTIIQVLVFTVFLIGASNILGVQGLLANGMSRAFRNIVLTSGMVNLTLIVPFWWHFGIIGPAISVVLVELLVAVLEFIVLHRHGLL